MLGRLGLFVVDADEDEDDDDESPKKPIADLKKSVISQQRIEQLEEKKTHTQEKEEALKKNLYNKINKVIPSKQTNKQETIKLPPKLIKKVRKQNK